MDQVNQKLLKWYHIMDILVAEFVNSKEFTIPVIERVLILGQHLQKLFHVFEQEIDLGFV